MALVGLVGSGEMKGGYLCRPIQMQGRGSECLGRSVIAPTRGEQRKRGGGGLMNLPKESQFSQCGSHIVIANSLPLWRCTLRDDVEKKIKS